MHRISIDPVRGVWRRIDTKLKFPDPQSPPAVTLRLRSRYTEVLEHFISRFLHRSATDSVREVLVLHETDLTF